MLNKTILVLCFLFVGALSFANEAPENKPSSVNNGLFVIQFSWNKESFSDKLLVGVSYQRKAFLSKQKASGYNMASVGKNMMLSLELKDGEYDLVSVNLTGKDIGTNKVLKVPLEATFTIKNGQVTNGGLIFIGKEQKTDTQVYSIKINNTKDVQRYVGVHKKEYSNKLENIVPAYKFLPNEKLDNIITAYVETLMATESRKPRPKVKYLYTTLGIFVKMEKDEKGKVLSYEIVPTPSYQEIKKATKRANTIVCELWNAGFWFGNDTQIDYMKLPGSMSGLTDMYRFGKNQFLLVDNKFNFYSADEDFNWKEQTEHSYDRVGTSYYFFPPTVYWGPKNIYIYTKGSGGNRNIFAASYDDLHFKAVALSKDIKRVTFVTETDKKLFIGPMMRPVPKAKKPAYLFFKEHGQETWQTITLPRGDCNNFGPDRKNDEILYIECSREKIPFNSQDLGKTWASK